MDFPLYIELGPLRLHPHLVFEVLSVFIGFRYFLFLRRHQDDKISASDRVWIFVGAASGALIGSRFLGALETPVLFWEGGGDMGWLYFYQQKTIVGGLLGGLIGVEATKKVIRVTTSSGDLFTFPLILGITIGRIGCWLTGVEDGTAGLPSDLPWTMDLGDGIMRHPTALYEILFLLLLWIVLQALKRRVVLVDGARFKLFMVAYLLFRLGIDSIKPGFRMGGVLTVIQLACILGLLYYYQVFLFPGRLGERPTSTSQPVRSHAVQ